MKNILIIGFALLLFTNCNQSLTEQEKEDKSVKVEKININKLDEVAHIKGRIASQDDVEKGIAVFSANPKGEEHTPLAIPIPSLAYHINQETKKKTLVVIVQGEKIGDKSIVGYKKLDGTDGACLKYEIEFVKKLKEIQP